MMRGLYRVLVFTVLAASVFGCVKAESEPAREQDAAVAKKTPARVFPVYTDKSSPDNHFIPSGWMGDHMDLKLDDGYGEGCHSGATCIKISYNNKASGGARWVGVYWQYPANNWGGSAKHYDLSEVSRLTFWIKGERGGEVIQEVKMGGIFGEYSDSDTAGIGPLTLTKEWKQYVIDLSGKDLSHIIGGFVWSTNLDVNPQGAVFYLDDIRYE